MNNNFIKKTINSIKLHGVGFTLQMIKFVLTGGNDPRNTPEFINRMHKHLEPKLFVEDLKQYYTEAESLSEDKVKKLRRALLPIDCMLDLPGNKKRINLVLNHLNEKTLENHREVIELTIAYANRHHYDLRFITRSSAPRTALFYKKMEQNKIALPDNIEFYCDIGRNNYGDSQYKLPITKDDIFIVTKWYSAIAVKFTTINPNLFYYIDKSSISSSPEQNNLSFQLLGKNTYGLIQKKELWTQMNMYYPEFTKQALCIEECSTEEICKFMENIHNG